MKQIGDMTVEELGGLVCQAPADSGIEATLTGGASVTIWSAGKYVSYDLHFIEEGPVPRRAIRQVLETLGFVPKGRHFAHPDTRFFVEFPTGPLLVGGQRVERVSERVTPVGKLLAAAVPHRLRKGPPCRILSLARRGFQWEHYP